MSQQPQRGPTPYPYPPPAPSLFARIGSFWNRVSEGMKLNELWKQLHTDARSTYRLYSREIQARQPEGAPRQKHFFTTAKHYFWAILEKLTPARRVVLLVALVLLFLPEGVTTGPSGERWQTGFETNQLGGILLLGLLVLELTDRVVMKRDLQIAKEIQTWLLPAQPPQIPGLEIAFATRPANTVAGDYYDVLPRGGAEPGGASAGTYLFAVADVAGKSIPAALLMATIQASLRTLNTTPGSLLELTVRMNRYACSNSQDGRRFTTAFLAEYDPATRVLSYVNAGHNAPLLRRASGAIETLETGGLPLGVMESAPYQSGSVTLAAGDLLAIFTDGLVEAENMQAQEYGEARLRMLLQSCAAAPAGIILGALLDDIGRFAGGAPQHDDVTLMLLKTA